MNEQDKKNVDTKPQDPSAKAPPQGEVKQPSKEEVKIYNDHKELEEKVKARSAHVAAHPEDEDVVDAQADANLQRAMILANTEDGVAAPTLPGQKADMSLTDSEGKKLDVGTMKVAGEFTVDEIAEVACAAQKVFVEKLGEKNAEVAERNGAKPEDAKDEEEAKEFDSMDDEEKKMVRLAVLSILSHKSPTPSIAHSNYVKMKMRQGWQYGKKFDAKLKTDPTLLSYHELTAAQMTKERVFLNMILAFKDVI